jgi:hypothetical protein
MLLTGIKILYGFAENISRLFEPSREQVYDVSEQI